MSPWLVLRANQKWARFPDSDPVAARALMARFYRLLKVSEGANFNPARAAELEVDWWRAHRENQHGGADGSVRELEESLTALYACTYGADADYVRAAAVLRARAMDVSDRWVEAGRDPQDPLLREERALLVRSYAALLATVHVDGERARTASGCHGPMPPPPGFVASRWRWPIERAEPAARSSVGCG